MGKHKTSPIRLKSGVIGRKCNELTAGGGLRRQPPVKKPNANVQNEFTKRTTAKTNWRKKGKRPGEKCGGMGKGCGARGGVVVSGIEEL